MRKIKRGFSNSIVWISAFVGCVVFSGAMLMGVIFVLNHDNSAIMELENSYKSSFSSMTESAQKMELELSKMMVSNDEQLIMQMAQQTMQEANSARQSLQNLSVNSKSKKELDDFFTKVWLWCKSFCHCLSYDGETSIFQEELEHIQKTTQTLAGELDDISKTYQQNGYSLTKTIGKHGIKSVKDFALPTVEHRTINIDLNEWNQESSINHDTLNNKTDEANQESNINHDTLNKLPTAWQEDDKSIKIKQDSIPLIDMREAKGLVNPKLTISGCEIYELHQNGNKTLCYQIRAVYKNQQYKIYIDAISGKELKITRD